MVEPTDATQQILQKIQEGITEIKADTKTIKTDLHDVALRTTLIEVRLGAMQGSIDRIREDVDAIKKHVGLVKV